MQVARLTPTEESELVNEVHINTAEIPDFVQGQPRRSDAGSDPTEYFGSQVDAKRWNAKTAARRAGQNPQKREVGKNDITGSLPALREQ